MKRRRSGRRLRLQAMPIGRMRRARVGESMRPKRAPTRPSYFAETTLIWNSLSASLKDERVDAEAEQFARIAHARRQH